MTSQEPDRVPCGSCPWRLQSDPSGDSIPGYDIDMMRDLENTVSPDGQDGWFPIMACHASDEGDEEPCIGYVAQEGHQNIAVRLLAYRDSSIAAVMHQPNQWDLHADYQAMSEAMEAASQEQSSTQ